MPGLLPLLYQIRLVSSQSTPSSCPSPRGEKGRLNHPQREFQGPLSPWGENGVKMVSCSTDFISWDLHVSPEPWHWPGRRRNQQPGKQTKALLRWQPVPFASKVVIWQANRWLTMLLLEASRPRTRGPARRTRPISRMCRFRTPVGSAAAPVDADPESIRDLAFSIIRVLNRDGEAVGPWAGLLGDRGIARRPARHDDAARLRRAHADGAAAGQDLVLHAAHGRGGGSCAFARRSRPGDMNFPTYRQAGPADRRAAIRSST